MAKRNYFPEKSEYTVNYTLRGGVDFTRGGAVSRDRLAYAENMYRDYDGSGGKLIESIPGIRTVASFGGKIHSMFSQYTSGGYKYLVVHQGNSLHRVAIEGKYEFNDVKFLKNIENRKSCAYPFGYDIYVIDGKDITKISEDGTAESLGYGSNQPYIPITYDNGVPHEQRNLLTSKVKERYIVTDLDLYRYGSENLIYAITNTTDAQCSVIGLSDGFEGGELVIPSYAQIGGAKYKVQDIKDGVFMNNTAIERVVINPGTVRIGNSAFEGCTSLTSVHLERDVSQIGERAFCGCTALKEVYFGEELRTIKQDAFRDAPLEKIYYKADKNLYSEIDGFEETAEAEIVNYENAPQDVIALYLHAKAFAISHVTVGGKRISVKKIFNANDEFIGITMTADSLEWILGEEILVNYYLSSKEYELEITDAENTEQDSFTNKLTTPLNTDSILKCTVCEIFDGRIFLSGNADFPNTVFYSCKDDSGNSHPLYFGSYNYFNDGIGSSGVISMLATGDGLAVFKSQIGAGGSIFFHKPADTNDNLVPRIYPVSYIHNGVCAIGPSSYFFDDAVFLSKNGLCAIEKQNINYERSIVCRSHNVNPRLLSQDLAQAHITGWCGYLVIAVGSDFYLADSRAMFKHSSGSYEYEWYYLCGIGYYGTDAQPIYRYSSIAENGYAVYHAPDEEAEGTVYSETVQGKNFYFVTDGAKRYSVYKSEQIKPTRFSAATVVHCVDDKYLFFGTDTGELCIFNNDMRSVPPPYVKELSDYNEEEYLAAFANKIHPYFYTFMNHAPKYALKCALDDCGIPNLTKDTVKNSLTVKGCIDGGGKLLCEVCCDLDGYSEELKLHNSVLDFSCIDFSSLSLSTDDRLTIPIKEKKKGWVEKQISLSSSDFRCPIGVESVTYRFAVKGRIKMN